MLFYEEINGCWSMGKFYKLIWLKIYSYTVYSILIFLNNNRKKKAGERHFKNCDNAHEKTKVGFLWLYLWQTKIKNILPNFYCFS